MTNIDQKRQEEKASESEIGKLWEAFAASLPCGAWTRHRGGFFRGACIHGVSWARFFSALGSGVPVSSLGTATLSSGRYRLSIITQQMANKTKLFFTFHDTLLFSGADVYRQTHKIYILTASYILEGRLMNGGEHEVIKPQDDTPLVLFTGPTHTCCHLIQDKHARHTVLWKREENACPAEQKTFLG